MNNKYKHLIIVFLIVASLIAFGRILANDFVNYDDDRLITNNIHVQSGINTESIKWAFTNSSLEYWHPLTWLSIMLEWRMFGAKASGYHLVSLLLHIGAVLFLFLFLNKTTKRLWPSAFVAALFALHPLRVESVAWAAEHKDVLSMFFGMASLYAYAYYVEKRQVSKYLLCLMLFVLSLMSKPTLVTLPCVLLLLDYWPLSRWQKQIPPVSVPVVTEQKTGKKKNKQRKVAISLPEKKITAPVNSPPPSIGNLLLEKVPFFLLSIILGVLLIGQLRADSQMYSLQDYAFSQRIMNALVSYLSYLGKTFWPVDLAVFYPLEYSFPMWQVFGAAAVLLLITLVVIYLVKRAPFLAVGWFWYLGTLFPVSGLLQAGGQAMADRYTYLPSIGIGIMLTWGVIYFLPQEHIRKKVLLPAAGIVLFILTILTWQQCGHWKNTVSLFSHVLQVTKNNYLAHTSFGVELLKDGKTQEAVDHFRAALQIKPDSNLAHYNLARAFQTQGKINESMDSYRQTIRISPNFFDAHNNLGLILITQNKIDEALPHFLLAKKIRPDDPNIDYILGMIMVEKGDLAKGIEHLRRAVYVNPNNAKARQALRIALTIEQKQKR